MSWPCLILPTWRPAARLAPRATFRTGVSVGLVDGRALLDLAYVEDSRAEVDLNVVGNERGDLLEIQGTAEGAPFSRPQLDALLTLAEGAIASLQEHQRQALAVAPPTPTTEMV